MIAYHLLCFRCYYAACRRVQLSRWRSLRRALISTLADIKHMH